MDYMVHWITAGGIRHLDAIEVQLALTLLAEQNPRLAEGIRMARDEIRKIATMEPNMPSRAEPI